MSDTPLPLEKFWLELREPGCVPELKGPWPDFETAKVLREVMDVRPTAKITVITWHDGRPLLQDGPECLMMCDGRSMQRARRHIKSSTQAEAAPSPATSPGPQDVWERVAKALKETGCTSPDGTFVHEATRKVLDVLLAALAQSDAQPVRQRGDKN